MSLPQDLTPTSIRVQHTSILPRLVVAPEAPLRGALAFNTPDENLYFADGTQWKRILDEDDAFLDGDVTGALLTNTVERIRGVTISAVAPTAGQVLTLVGGVWTPQTPSGVVALGGDVTGPSGTNTVVKIQNFPVSAVAPAPGQVLTDVAGVWTPAPIPPPAPGTSPAHSIVGFLVTQSMLAVPSIYTFSGGGATVILTDSCVSSIQANWYGTGAMASANISGFAQMQFQFGVSWTVASGPTMTCDIDMPALWTAMGMTLAWVGTNTNYFTRGLMPFARNNIGVQGYVNVTYPSPTVLRFEWSTGAASLSQEVNVSLIMTLGGNLP